MVANGTANKDVLGVEFANESRAKILDAHQLSYACRVKFGKRNDYI
jgi:hypothetical protein